MMRYRSLRLNPPRRSPDPSTFLPVPASKRSSDHWPPLPGPASRSYSQFFSDFSHIDESRVKSQSYDVFVSSNGVDKFAVELSSALRQLGFRVFKDEQLTVTNFAPPEVLEAIDRSRVFVVVFSEEYASSTRCLEELAKIIECWKANNQAVVLVFYGVRPSDVWHTEGKFAEKLSRHANSYWRDRVRTWSLALNETAWIVGYEWMESELALIDDVVKDVSRKLYVKDRNKLIGVDSRVRRILSSECLDPSGVHILGVWGMGGIGKTTIARELFNMISVQYESCYILEEFRQMVRRKGLTHLREEFLSKIFKEEILTISGSDMKQSFMKHRLRNKKVLVVLDDVNDSREVEILVGGLDWFGPGSRVIITSRNRQVLVQLKVKEIYEVERLDNQESLQLFCYYSFEQDGPREDYYGRSRMVINYADGVPFALKVLGSYMWDKGLNWQTTFWRLQQHPPTEIQNIFQRSFGGLDDNEKNIFLDLAFFFVGQHTDYVYRLLDGCGFFTLVGTSGLVDKSLVTISEGTVVMHNVFKDMGRYIVREENKDPGKRSRLLVPEDIGHVLTKNTGTEAIEGIFLDASNSSFGLGATVFQKMYNLRLLKIYVPGSQKQGCRLSLSEGLECLPDELRLLHWEYDPLSSLPRKYNPNNLVELNMPCSDLEKLWKGTKNLSKLKKIRLSHSEHLRKIPRLSKSHSLEHVDLEGCISLVKVTSSICHLQKLVFLNLKDCVKLQYMPATIHLESLEVLNLSGCSELEKIQEISRNLRELYLAGTSIRELPQSIESLSRLSILDLDNCKKLQHIPAGLRTLKSLFVLKTSGFSKTEKFVETTESMRLFHSLDSSNIASKELFPSLLNLVDDENRSKSSDVHCNLLVLEDLNTSESATREPNASFQCLSDPIIFNPASLRRHRIKIMLSSIKVLPTSISHSLAYRLHSLVYLYLCNSRVLDIPEEICCLCSLKTLNLSRNSFQILPESIRKLSKLQKLRICRCKNLEMLPELPGSLEYLDAHGCTSLESISSCFEQIPSSYLFTNCFKLDPNTLKVFLTRAFSRVEQLIKQHQQRSVRSPSFRICLPGTAFWNWRFVRPASSVMIQLSPSQRKILLGFVVSVVVTFLDYRNDSGFAIRCICSWKNKKAVSQRLERIFPGCDPRDTGPSIKEDHMFIYFDPAILPDAEGGNSVDESGDLIRFEFYPVDQKNNIISSCRIEKCGVHVLTSMNIYTSGVSMKRPSSSSDSVKLVYGVESGPPRKRPRIKWAIEAVIYEIRQSKRKKKDQADNALVQVTAHAVQANDANMQIKPHYSSSDQNAHPRFRSSVPASIPIESFELYPSKQQRTQQQTVDKSLNDGYNWRKYGQKVDIGGMFPMSYYRCTNPGCTVKKKVETSLDGQVTKIIYKGQHNHQFHTGGGFKVKNDNETSQATTEEIPEAVDSKEVSDSGSRMRVKDEDEPDAKRRSTEIRVSKAASSSQMTVSEPTVSLQITSEVDILDDGYRWRKYGKKLVKENPHPRSYYKCLFQGCNVRKHVERAPMDPKALIITYQGKHNHDQPAARTGSHAVGSSSQLTDDSVNSSSITEK